MAFEFFESDERRKLAAIDEPKVYSLCHRVHKKEYLDLNKSSSTWLVERRLNSV